MSRSKWQDMVKDVLDVVAPTSKTPTPKQDTPKEKKGLSLDDIPGDPGSTVGTLREHKKRMQELSDM